MIRSLEARCLTPSEATALARESVSGNRGSDDARAACNRLSRTTSLALVAIPSTTPCITLTPGLFEPDSLLARTDELERKELRPRNVRFAAAAPAAPVGKENAKLLQRLRYRRNGRERQVKTRLSANRRAACNTRKLTDVRTSAAPKEEGAEWQQDDALRRPISSRRRIASVTSALPASLASLILRSSRAPSSRRCRRISASSALRLWISCCMRSATACEVPGWAALGIVWLAGPKADPCAALPPPGGREASCDRWRRGRMFAASGGGVLGFWGDRGDAEGRSVVRAIATNAGKGGGERGISSPQVRASGGRDVVESAACKDSDPLRASRSHTTTTVLSSATASAKVVQGGGVHGRQS
eukprot:scaffold22589_cov27-Tisochrysis_lutea.AAC.1